MVGSDFMDEIDCGSFFDQFDDLIEFPADNECGLGSGKCTDFPSIWSNTSDALPVPGPIFSGNSSSVLSAELSDPYEDIMQLEWLSNFMDDSLPGGGMILDEQDSPANKDSPSHSQFQTSSPISVLESSSSSSSSSDSWGKKLPLISPTQHGPQRARSKRPRPASFNPRPPIQLISPISSVAENFVESHPMKKIPKSTAASEEKKKKKRKLSLPLVPTEENQIPQSQSVRKCMHCEITKTPQWRAGPMGPKTLCNACGVRFKSGRLFPEYRPAASPTFVPALHSNSHKKVVEMRTKGGSGEKSSSAVATPEPELIPNNIPSLGCI